MGKVNFKFSSGDYTPERIKALESRITNEINEGLKEDKQFLNSNWIIGYELTHLEGNSLNKNIDYGSTPIAKAIDIDDVVNKAIRKHLISYTT